MQLSCSVLLLKSIQLDICVWGTAKNMNDKKNVSSTLYTPIIFNVAFYKEIFTVPKGHYTCSHCFSKFGLV